MRTSVVPSGDIKQAIESGQGSAFIGHEFNVSGIVQRVEAPALEETHFCVCLDNGVLCEFYTDTLNNLAYEWWHGELQPMYYSYGMGWLKVRVENGQIYLMRAHAWRHGGYADFQRERELFRKGTHVTIHGTCKGPGMFGLTHGLLFQGCQLTTLAGSD